ncbi:hypothetical protein GA0070615_1521 [Micromonospora aurantiaca]|nr:hypothetical protein GA0070615_1521 [Micromonospora aurantiaca]
MTGEQGAGASAGTDRPDPGTHPPDGPHASIVLMARIRATGVAPAQVSSEVVAAAAVAAAAVDRQLVEVVSPTGARREFVLGWTQGAAPDPTQHPSAPPRTLSAVPYLVWAACLAAAWPDPTAPPYPGRPFARAQVLRTCVGLGAHDDAVVRALDGSLPQAGLITAAGAIRRLGPAVAALPGSVWSALTRFHDRLPRLAPRPTPSKELPVGCEAAAGAQGPAGGRKVPAPQPGPLGVNESIVRAAAAALEMARGAVARTDVPALADPALRRSLEHSLAACGRILISTPEGNWITGFPDSVADVLVEAEAGTLSRTERAVLALVLLRTVAIPRAHGHHHHEHWTVTTRPTTIDELATNRRLTRRQIRDGVRGLRAAGYLATTKAGHYVPGPALQRIGAARAASLWEDLVLLGRPDGHMAAKIRSRRELLRPNAGRPSAMSETDSGSQG